MKYWRAIIQSKFPCRIPSRCKYYILITKVYEELSIHEIGDFDYFITSKDRFNIGDTIEYDSDTWWTLVNNWWFEK